MSLGAFHAGKRRFLRGGFDSLRQAAPSPPRPRGRSLYPQCKDAPRRLHEELALPNGFVSSWRYVRLTANKINPEAFQYFLYVINGGVKSFDGTQFTVNLGPSCRPVVSTTHWLLNPQPWPPTPIKTDPLNSQPAGNPDASATCCHWRHKKLEKSCDPFRGKTETERRRNFENFMSGLFMFAEITNSV